MLIYYPRPIERARKVCLPDIVVGTLNPFFSSETQGCELSWTHFMHTISMYTMKEYNFSLFEPNTPRSPDYNTNTMLCKTDAQFYRSEVRGIWILCFEQKCTGGAHCRKCRRNIHTQLHRQPSHSLKEYLEGVNWRRLLVMIHYLSIRGNLSRSVIASSWRMQALVTDLTINQHRGFTK